MTCGAAPASTTMSGMLCGCSRQPRKKYPSLDSDQFSAYGFTPRRPIQTQTQAPAPTKGQAPTQAQAQGLGRAAGGSMTGSGRRRTSASAPSSGGRSEGFPPPETALSDSMSPVLRCDHSEYPGTPAHLQGTANMAFDSGIESATSPDSTKIGILKSLDGDQPHPVLEFSEKGDNSDGTKPRKMYQSYKGQLKISVYMNSGLLTVHVIEAKHLVSKWSAQPCSFVRVTLTPDDSGGANCNKTKTFVDSTQPKFDEKFSFEVSDNDKNRRLLISVWSKHPNHNHSELLGCMSFGVRRIISRKTVVQDWYFLLSEHVGNRKHLQAHNKRHLVVEGDDIYSSTSDSQSANDPDTAARLAANPDPDSAARLAAMSDPDMLTTCTLDMERGDAGYGFVLCGGSPAKVFSVEPDSPADLSGLRTGDHVTRLNGQDMSRATADTVARVVRFCDSLVLEVKTQDAGSQPWCSSPMKQAPPTGRDFVDNESSDDGSYRQQTSRMVSTGGARYDRERTSGNGYTEVMTSAISPIGRVVPPPIAAPPGVTGAVAQTETTPPFGRYIVAASSSFLRPAAAPSVVRVPTNGSAAPSSYRVTPPGIASPPGVCIPAPLPEDAYFVKTVVAPSGGHRDVAGYIVTSHSDVTTRGTHKYTVASGVYQGLGMGFKAAPPGEYPVNQAVTVPAARGHYGPLPDLLTPPSGQLGGRH